MRALALLLLPFWALHAGEWDASAGLGGTYLNSGGNDAETFYWGPFAGVGYQMNDDLHLRGDVRHSRDRLLYDGLGGIARQSFTGLGPGISWDFSENWNFDAEYKFRFGENSYTEHEIATALEYSGLKRLRFAGDVGYSNRSYNFPATGVAIRTNSTSYTLEAVPELTDWLELPVTGNIFTSSYSTNSSAYTVYSFSAGANVFLAERRWRIGAAVSPGRDSSNYTLLGGDLRVRFRATDNISLRAFASITSYSFVTTQTAKSKRASGTAVNPLGNSDSFMITTVGLDATYSF